MHRSWMITGAGTAAGGRKGVVKGRKGRDWARKWKVSGKALVPATHTKMPCSFLGLGLPLDSPWTYAGEKSDIGPRRYFAGQVTYGEASKSIITFFSWAQWSPSPLTTECSMHSVGITASCVLVRGLDWAISLQKFSLIFYTEPA